MFRSKLDFLAQVSKKLKVHNFFQENFPPKISSVHVEGSFEHPTENVRLTTRKQFTQSPKKFLCIFYNFAKVWEKEWLFQKASENFWIF